jgi:hypothetical protein
MRPHATLIRHLLFLACCYFGIGSSCFFLNVTYSFVFWVFLLWFLLTKFFFLLYHSALFRSWCLCSSLIVSFNCGFFPLDLSLSTPRTCNDANMSFSQFQVGLGNVRQGANLNIIDAFYNNSRLFSLWGGTLCRDVQFLLPMYSDTPEPEFYLSMCWGI